MAFCQVGAVLAGQLPPHAWIGKPVASGPILPDGTVDVTGGETHRETLYVGVYDMYSNVGDVVAKPLLRRGETAAPATNDRLIEWRSPAGRLLTMDWNERRIFTANGERSHLDGWKGVPFNPEYRDQFYAFYENDDADARHLITEEAVNYIRGDRSNEKPIGRGFRSRVGLMGEIIHSNIYLATYSDQPNEWDGRPPERLFVGSGV